MGKLVLDLKQRALHLVESISCHRNDVVENTNPNGKGGKSEKKSSKVLKSTETEDKPNKVAVESVKIKEKLNEAVAESVAIESAEIDEKPNEVVVESVVAESVEIKETSNEVVVESVAVESVEFKEKPNDEVVVVESVEIKRVEKVEIQERALFQVNAATETRRSAQRGGNPGTGGRGTKKK